MNGDTWPIANCQLPIGDEVTNEGEGNRSFLQELAIGNRQSPLITHRAWTIALLLLLSSCAAPLPTPMDYTVRHMQQRDRNAALDAAEAALIDLGYKIEQRDPAEGVITTQPVVAQTGLDSTRPASLSSRGNARRIVEVRVQIEGGVTKVFCKVLIQEQTTQAHRMFAADRTGSDTPGDYTAINRDAATTNEQNTVWRTLRRDKSAERDILKAVTGRTGGEVRDE